MTRPADPTRIAAILLAAPALLLAAFLAWSEVWSPDALPVVFTTSFTEALRDDTMEIAFEHIRHGRDPNAPAAYRDERLTGGEELMLTPLIIAVGRGQGDTVSMLLSSGARLDIPGSRYAVCLARRLGHTRIAGVLLENGGPGAAEEVCPSAPHDDDAPLRAYVE